MSLDILKFKHPFTCIVAGCTSSGKTVFVEKLLENWEYLIDINVKKLKVLWCNGTDNNTKNQFFDNIEIFYFRGIPSVDDIQSNDYNIIVLDDLMNEVKYNENVKSLFTKHSHHLNISVIFITQNIFSQDKSMRTISLNAHYIVILKSIRLTQQIGILANQIWPHKSKKLIDVYKAATDDKYSYLLLDLHPNQSEDKFRIRNRIFRDELPQKLSEIYYSVPIFYSLD